MPYSVDEINQIGEELKKLYSVQGKYVTHDVLDDMLEDIKTWNFPAGAVIAGIRVLKSEQLREITLWRVKDATKSRMEPVSEAPRGSNCRLCCGTGTVGMVMEGGGTYTFKCICSEGRNPQNAALFPWNGKRHQMYRGKQMEYYHADTFEMA